MDKAVNERAVRGQEAAPLSDREKNVIIGGALLSMLLAALDQTIVAPAMPEIAVRVKSSACSRSMFRSTS